MKYAKSAVICRAALRAGPLEICHFGNLIAWRHGRRTFSAAVIVHLIGRGEAVRVGDIVRAT